MLLEWVHRKFRQDSRTSVKDSALGTACICFLGKPVVDDEESKIKSGFSTRNGPRSFKQSQPSNPESYFGLGNGKEETCQEEICNVNSDLFHGFLTIGTFGAETIENEPATPTFAMPLENITEGKTRLTNDDLRLIHNELEKLLQEETKDEGSYESSGRDSCVSTITLSGKQVEGDEAEDSRKSAACPLQGYLFASSICELPQKRTEVKKEKATLGELFQRAKTYETAEGEAQMIKPQTARPAMKKMMKKLHGYWKHPGPAQNGTDTVSTNKKPFKVLRMLQRKIYPETRASAKECNTFHGKKIHDVLSNSPHEYTTGIVMHVDEASRLPPKSMRKKWKQSSKINLNQPHNAHSENKSCGNKEHWIKTDADYFVLELKQLKQ